MEISPLMIYLIDISSSIDRLLEIVLLVSLVTTMGFVIFAYECDIRKIKMSLKKWVFKMGGYNDRHIDPWARFYSIERRPYSNVDCSTNR